MSKEKKNARIEMACEPSFKKMLEKASKKSFCSVSDYIRQSVLEKMEKK